MERRPAIDVPLAGFAPGGRGFSRRAELVSGLLPLVFPREERWIAVNPPVIASASQAKAPKQIRRDGFVEMASSLDRRHQFAP
jgi:hypothetical protein